MTYNQEIPDDQKGVQPAQTHPHFDAFVQTIARLRAPGGCPWDIKQTHASAKKHIIEEAYECVEAIEQGDMDHLREELGDLLEQVVLQSQIAADCGAFTIDDVCRDVNEKIIRRHPHVFGEGDEQVSSPEEVLDLWNKVKQEERAARAEQTQQVVHELESIPRALPALMGAQKISTRMAKRGFEYHNINQIWNDVYEEIDEYKAEPANSSHAVMEFGDLLFTLVNVARFDSIDAEEALRMASEKVRRRWAYMEDTIAQRGLDVAQLTDDEWETLWTQAKAKEESNE